MALRGAGRANTPTPENRTAPGTERHTWGVVPDETSATTDVKNATFCHAMKALQMI